MRGIAMAGKGKPRSTPIKPALQKWMEEHNCSTLSEVSRQTGIPRGMLKEINKPGYTNETLKAHMKCAEQFGFKTLDDWVRNIVLA